MRCMKLSDIKISQSFLDSVPSQEKIQECKNRYSTYGRQDRYIVVNHENTLIDGYIFYLVAKELGISEVQVKISERRKKRWFRKNYDDWNIPKYRRQPTTYVFGYHPMDTNRKEYVWRVPDSWIGFEDYLNIGDMVLVGTKHGAKAVVVTRVERLDKCPTDLKVKKVVKKIKNSGTE